MLIPCWDGPQFVWLHGKQTTTVRALFAVLFNLDEMHITWRAQRACLNPECVNPHHHQLHLVNSRTGVAIQPLPAVAAFEASKRIELEVDETEDAMDMILMVEGGRAMPAEDLVARFGGAYDHSTITEALKRIHAGGL